MANPPGTIFAKVAFGFAMHMCTKSGTEKKEGKGGIMGARAFLRVLTVLVGAIVLLTVPPNAPAERRRIELRCAHTVTSTHPSFVALQSWAEDIRQRSSGAVNIAIYPGGVLCPTFEVYKAVKSGTVQMGAGPTGFFGPSLELNQFLGNCLAGFRLPEEVVPVWKKALERIAALKDELSEVRVLGLYATDPMTLATKEKRILRLEDIKGLPMRCPPGLEPVLKAWGVVPVTMPIVDIYAALQKATVKGYVGGASMLESFKLAEQVRYVVPLHMIYGMNIVFMNREVWNSLPSEVQSMFEETRDALETGLARAYVQEIRNAMDFARQKGVEFIELEKPEWRRFYELRRLGLKEIQARLDSKGKPGTKVLEYAESVNRIQ